MSGAGGQRRQNLSTFGGSFGGHEVFFIDFFLDKKYYYYSRAIANRSSMDLYGQSSGGTHNPLFGLMQDAGSSDDDGSGSGSDNDDHDAHYQPTKGGSPLQVWARRRQRATQMQRTRQNSCGREPRARAHPLMAAVPSRRTATPCIRTPKSNRRWSPLRIPPPHPDKQCSNFLTKSPTPLPSPPSHPHTHCHPHVHDTVIRPGSNARPSRC